ncbi:hypothetical protein SARC_07500, partial [Sphaeroforma arctica JP610]
MPFDSAGSPSPRVHDTNEINGFRYDLDDISEARISPREHISTVALRKNSGNVSSPRNRKHSWGKDGENKAVMRSHSRLIKEHSGSNGQTLLRRRSSSLQNSILYIHPDTSSVRHLTTVDDSSPIASDDSLQLPEESIVPAKASYAPPLVLHTLRVYNNSQHSCGWNNEGAWVAGLAFGNSPLDLQFGTNAAITCANVKDATAGYILDTFILPSEPGGEDDGDDDNWLMFMEVMNFKSSQGDIAMAWSPDRGGRKRTGQLIMIPDTSEISEVRAYIASEDTPTEWRLQKTLLRGKAYSDPTVFHFGGMWYMYTWIRKTNSLHLHSSRSIIEGEWAEHPLSPLQESLVHPIYRRPGGRPVAFDGVLFRFARESAHREAGHGTAAVWAVEISTLNATHYKEKPVRRIGPTGGTGWASKRVSSVDVHRVSNGLYIAAVSADHLNAQPVTAYFLSTVLLWFAILSLIFASAFVTTIYRRIAATRRKVKKYVMSNVYTHPFAMLMCLLCIAFLVLWQFDFLLDCRPPLNVVQFTGVGPLCKDPLLMSTTESCEDYLALAEFDELENSPKLSKKKHSVRHGTRKNNNGQGGEISVEEAIEILDDEDQLPEVLPSTTQLNLHPCEVTLVTALFDLGKYKPGHEEQMEEKFQSRGFDKYQTWFLDVLALKTCLVIYIEPETEPLVWSHREAHNTVVHIVDDILQGYEMLDKIQKVLDDEEYISSVKRPGRPEMQMAAYGVTMYKKIDYLQETVLANPFSSEFFFWLDGGYGHGRRMPDFEDDVWPDPEKVRKYVSPYQVFILQADEPDANDCADLRSKFARHKTTMAGGFFGGKAEPLLAFHASFHRQLENTLDMGILDDDQAVFFASWCEKHSLFQIEQCPPNVLCQIAGTQRCFDRWNCAISFFASGD